FAPPEPLGVAGGEVHAVEEGAVPLGGGALAAEVDRAILDADDGAAAGEAGAQGRSGVVVAVLGGAVPDQAGLGRWGVHLVEPRPRPAAVAVVLADHRRAGGHGGVEPGEAGEAVLGAQDLAGLAGEGVVEDQEAVAVGNLVLGVPLIEGLDPQERVWRGVAPREAARAFLDPLDGDLLAEGDAGDLADDVAFRVPHL